MALFLGIFMSTESSDELDKVLKIKIIWYVIHVH